jgi:multidrug efflux pump
VLAIGLVVDDAIVMLENIYRHIEEGMHPFPGRHPGRARDRLCHRRHDAHAGGGVRAAGLHAGAHGRLFVEFALALAGAVVVSGFVALTLSPMLCSGAAAPQPQAQLVRPLMERWLTAWRRLRPALLRARAGRAGRCWLRAAGDGRLAPAPAGGCLPAKQELSPLEDRGVILPASTRPTAPRWPTPTATRARSKPSAAATPSSTASSPTSATPGVAGQRGLRTVDWERAQRSTLEIARDLQPKVSRLPGVSAFPITPPSLGQGFRERPSTSWCSSDSYENLAASCAGR